MYTAEEKAVKLYEECGLRIGSVIRILGYPSPNCLRAWYSEWKARGCVHEEARGKFHHEQKEAAIEFWRNHNYSIKKTIEALGCPQRTTLSEWIEKYANRADKQKRAKLFRRNKESGRNHKKGQRVNLSEMTNAEKTEVIDALKGKYRLKELFLALAISRSS